MTEEPNLLFGTRPDERYGLDSGHGPVGCREDDSADHALELAGRGYQVRIYVPYGADWFGYWMRRVAESQGVRPDGLCD